jgi:hypothetical protein
LPLPDSGLVGLMDRACQTLLYRALMGPRDG